MRGARGSDLYGAFGAGAETELDAGAVECENLGGCFSEFNSIEFADDLGGAERLLSAEEF